MHLLLLPPQWFRNLGKIGSNLNQIARHLNEGGTFTEGMAKEVSGTRI
ncbi:MAG: MobC family plasmid mobilization relaxosome protein [Lachnospiraceae bacterium]|jgi:hypothetical protein|nr:MobC family plasmid mobilization relaxosome protein [Lachnospiraceae bacterium]